MNGSLKHLFTGLLVLLSLHLFAQPTFSVSPSSTLADEGTTFTVDITVSDFTNLASAQFPMSWNSSIISYQSISNINASLPGLSMSSFGLPGNGNVPDNQIIVSWNHPDFSGVNLADQSVLFSITFQAVTGGTTLLEFNPNLPQVIEILDPTGTDVGATTNNGMITVNGSTGGGPTDFFLDLADATGSTGDQVCLPLTVTNFTNILGMQFSVNYNASALTYTGPANFTTALSGFSTGSVGNPSSGNLTFTWNDPNATGASLPNGTTLVELCFTITGSSNTSVSFSGSPTPIEIINGDEMEETFTSSNSTVTVNGGTGGGPTDFFLNLPDAAGSTGDQVCLPVTVTNFNSILGMQFSVNYDAAALTYTGPANFTTALSGFSTGSVGNPSPGNITFTWNDPNATGASLPDGTTLVELCFTITGSSNTSVSFSGSPTPIEVINGNEMEVTFTSSGSTITVSGGTGGGPMDFFLNLPDAMGNTGDQVCLPVTVTNFNSILGMQFSVNYDAAALTYTGPMNFTTALSGFSAGSVGNPSAGNITFTWNDPNATGATLPDGTTLVELCFTITGSSNTSVSFSGSPTPIEVINGNEMEVTFTSSGSTITVSGGTGGGPMDFFLNLPDAMGNTGDQVCLPVTVTNFNSILGMQFSVNYDAAALTYTGPMNFTTALSGFSAGSVGNPSAGNITFTWNDPNATGATLPDGTTLVELCFTITGSSNTSVSFSGSPTPIEIINGNEMEVTFTSSGSTITVSGGTGGGPMDFFLDLADAMGNTGDQVCLPVTVTNFNSILGMQFSVNYDAAALTYTGPMNFTTTLSGFSAGSVGNPSTGNITFTWNDPNATGASLPDGTTLVELCFTITGSSNTSVSFSGSPTPIEIIDGDEMEVTFTSSGSTITVGGGTGGPMDFFLDLADAMGNTGDQVCLPVTVTNFNSILGMQFSVNYDAAALTYTGPMNFTTALSGFSAGSVGNPSAGNITFTWNDPNATGATLPDGTTLVELCFTITGSSNTSVSFSGSPTPIEIINGDEMEVTFTSSGSTITVGGGTGGPMDFFLDLADAMGNTGDQVCLPVTVTNFNSILGMQFSVNYDAAALTYTGPMNFTTALSGFSAGSVGNPSAGNITFTWNDPNATGATLPDGTTLVELCFTITGSSNTSVSFSGSPTPIEIIDGDEMEVTFTSSGSTITVGGGTGGPMDFFLNLPNATVSTGDEICLPLTVTNFDNILGMQFSVNYDDAALTYTGPMNFTTALSGFSAGSVGNPSSGNITFTWNDPNATGATLPDGTVLVELCFTVIGNSTTTVNFSGMPTPIEIVDGDENTVTFTSSESTITVMGGPITGFTLDLIDTPAQMGETVCMPMQVFNFNNILGMQFSVNYNAAALTYSGATNFATTLPGFSGGSVGNPSTGNLTFTWNDPNASGASLADETILVELCFVVNTDANTTLSFSGTPTPIEIIDGNEMEVVFTGNNGTFLFNQAPPTLGLSLTDVTATAGTSVCVPFSATTGFTDIASLSSSFTYDPAVLQFTGAQNFNTALTGLGAGSFTPAAGTVSVNWSSPAMAGVTVADNTVLAELCFNVLASTATTTPLAFAEMPSPIAATLSNGNEPEVMTTNATVTITDPAGTFSLSIPTQEVCDGVSFCADFVAGNFTFIQGMQFSITYNAADLAFTSVNNINTNIPGLTAASFNAAAGVITFQWTGASGVSLAPNSTLFSVCFNKISDNPTTLSVTGSPSPIQIMDTNNNMVAFAGTSTELTCTPIPPLQFGQVNVVNLDCADVPTGSITIVNMIDGSGNYTYQWSADASATGNSLINRFALTTTVTVTDTLTGMSVSNTYSITAPPLLTGSVDNITNILCAGQNSGSITVSGSGGVPINGGYNYDWSGSLMDGFNMTTQTGLFEGTYSVTISDANGCLRELVNIQVNELAEPLMLGGSVSQIPPAATGPGSINLEVNGGTPSYNYVWTGPGSYSFNGQDPNNITVPGEYCATVTDAFGCTANTCFTVYEELNISPFQIVSTPSCSDANTGAISITVTGGSCPDTIGYVWNNLTTGEMNIFSTQDISGLSPATYQVQVTDCLGNTVSANIEVGEIAAIGIMADVTNVVGQNDGAVDLTVSGGSGEFSYSWNNGFETQDLAGLSPGTYCVTITDEAGCTAEACFPVNAAPITPQIEDITNPSCPGDEDGCIELVITGGVLPYQITLSGLNSGVVGTFTALAGQVEICNLMADTFSYTLLDAEGNVFTSEDLIISDPMPITATATIVNDTEDTGGSGSVLLVVEGGTGNTTVVWSPIGNGLFINMLNPGMVTANITDANGCVLSVPYTVGQLTEEAVVTDTDCMGSATGSISVTATGAEPITYMWSVPGATTAEITDLTEGNYSVTITDATGARVIRNYDIGTQADFSVTAAVTNELDCFDSTNGSLTATVTNNGNSTIEGYEWEDANGSLVGTTQTLSNVGPGTYTVIAIDNNGCTAESMPMSISAPLSIELTEAIKDLSCDGNSDGEIFVAVTGGTAPYTYAWSTGGVTSQLSNLAPGNYTLSVTDVNSCQVIETYTIGESSPLIVMMETQAHTDPDFCNGVVTAIVMGGTPPYSYDWINITDSPDEATVTGLCFGTYFLQVTDANGCSSAVVEGTVKNEQFDCFEERVVITPDGNGSNDEFIIFCLTDEYNDNELEIYNRWGQLVFETNNYDNTWEGTSQNGDELPAGPYYWVLDYIGNNGEAAQIRGSLTIVRDN